MAALIGNGRGGSAAAGLRCGLQASGRGDREGRGQQERRDFARQVTAKLASMDAHEIAHSVISLGNPWYDFLPAEEAPAFACEINDLVLDLVRSRPDRLSCYAALPFPDLGAALAELDRVAAAGAKGIILSTRPGGLRLDDRALWSLFERLERLGLPVLLHPHYTIGAEDLDGYDHALPLVFGFPFETTIAVARLILSGTLDVFPRLRLIAAHLGGTMLCGSSGPRACSSAPITRSASPMSGLSGHR